MKEKLVKRFYCEHCRKSAGQRAAMVKHEAGCTANPNRKCNMCAYGNAVFATSETLVAAAFKGLETLWETSGHCPACTLSGIRLARKKVQPQDEEGFWTGPAADAYNSLGAFDWKKEAAQFWKDHPREKEW